MKPTRLILGACALTLGCTPPSSAAPTAADAKAFLDNVNETMLKLGIQQGQAGWVQQNFITDDTEALDARANQAAIDARRAVRQGGDAVRPGRGAGRPAPAAQPAEGRRS